MLNLRYYNVKLLISVVILLFIGIDQLFHLTSWLLNEYWSFFKENADKIRFIKAPTNGVVIMALLAWYDRKLWNKKILNKLVKVPDMRGRYAGELISNYLTNGSNTEIDCVLEITQTASTIKANMYFENSDPLKQTKSISTLETIEGTEDNNIFQLNFNHTNSGQREKGGLNKHEGVTMLLYNRDNRSFHGEYFNSPERGTYGQISVGYESLKLQHKF